MEGISYAPETGLGRKKGGGSELGKEEKRRGGKKNRGEIVRAYVERQVNPGDEHPSADLRERRIWGRNRGNGRKRGWKEGRGRIIAIQMQNCRLRT